MNIENRWREKFPKFNQSYGKAFESSRPGSSHHNSFVRGHLYIFTMEIKFFTFIFIHLVFSTGGQTREGKQFELKAGSQNTFQNALSLKVF